MSWVEAPALRRVYDNTRRAFLCDHPWHFAKKRASLPASAVAPAWGFSRGYPVPVDFLRLLAVKNGPDFSLEADAAGSQWIVSDAAAPAYWNVADADGNRSCICTPLTRG